jgi:hypothetical protein
MFRAKWRNNENVTIVYYHKIAHSALQSMKRASEKDENEKKFLSCGLIVVQEKRIHLINIIDHKAALLYPS